MKKLNLQKFVMILMSIAVFAIACDNDDDDDNDNNNTNTTNGDKYVHQIHEDGNLTMIFTFNSSNKLSHLKTYDYDVSGNMIDSSSVEYTYVSGILDRETYHNKIGTMLMYKVFEYDVNNRLSKITNYADFTGSGTFVTHTYTEYTYNSSNQIILEEEYDDFSGSYSLKGYSDYTYDADGNVSLEEVYSVTGGTPAFERSSEYIYDAKIYPVYIFSQDLFMGDIVTPNNATSRIDKNELGAVVDSQMITYLYLTNDYPYEFTETDHVGNTKTLEISYY